VNLDKISDLDFVVTQYRHIFAVVASELCNKEETRRKSFKISTRKFYANIAITLQQEAFWLGGKRRKAVRCRRK
jgi:hypothetical protein